MRRQGHAFKPERRQKRNPLIRFFDPIVARVALHTGPGPEPRNRPVGPDPADGYPGPFVPHFAPCACTSAPIMLVTN